MCSVNHSPILPSCLQQYPTHKQASFTLGQNRRGHGACWAASDVKTMGTSWVLSAEEWGWAKEEASTETESYLGFQ